MKRRSLFAALALAPLAGGAAAVVVGACGTDDFASVDSGTEGGDVTVDVTNDVRSDAGGDAGPKGWCATNAPTATACADFDDVDAASALAPAWIAAELGNGSIKVRPLTGTGDASLSPPNGLTAVVQPASDGGSAIATLSTSGNKASTKVVLEFSFLPPTTTGTNSIQRVEFASVAVNANAGGLYLALRQEGTPATVFQLAGMVPAPIGPITVNLAAGWHRIGLSLDKSTLKYQLLVDGNVDQSGNIATWPVSPTGTGGAVGALEVVVADQPQSGQFDSVVFTSK